MRKSLLLILIILTVGCVQGGETDDNSNQTEDYREQLDEEPEEEKEIEKVTLEINETEDEPALNVTDEREIIEEAIENQTEKEIPKKKYFDWKVKFEIYDTSKSSFDRFLTDEIFESEKDKILPLIPETEYRSYKLTRAVDIYNWTRNGFSMEVTREGYNIILEEFVEKAGGLYNGGRDAFTIRVNNRSISEYSIPIRGSFIIPNESELKFCEENRECILVDKYAELCCGIGYRKTAINGRYYDYWKDKLSQCGRPEGMGCGGGYPAGIYRFSEPKCIDNICRLIPTNELICNSSFYSKCETTSEDLWNVTRGAVVSCREVIESCNYDSELIPTNELICNSSFYSKCETTPEDQWDVTRSAVISCREVIELCK